MLFAFSIASAGVRKVWIASTGPKISSCVMRCDWLAFRNSDGRQKYPLVRRSHDVCHRFAPSSWPILQILLDLLQLHFGIDRADVGVFVQRIADDQRLHAVLQLADDRFVNAFLHEKPRAGAADVALVEEDSVDDSLDGLVDRRILENDVGGLSASSRVKCFFERGQGFLDESCRLRCCR